MMKMWAAIMVTALSMQAAPALAKAAPEKASVHTQDDMPFTEAFGASITRYRNCVLREVDQQALSDAATMANAAMSACAIDRGAVESQLASDILAQNPHHSEAVARDHAEQGMATVDPLIEQAAVERAHISFARVMI